MLDTQNAELPGIRKVIFSGCKELFLLDERIKGRTPPQIRYEYDIESETIYPRIEPDPTDDPTADAEDQPIIKPTIDFTETATQDIQTLDSLYDCNSFHDCAGVLG